MTKLSETSVLTRGTDFVATKVGHQTMMMSVSAGKYFALAETGQRIWDLLEAPRSIRDIVSVLVTEYNVAPEDCLTQVTRFVEDLRENGLVAEIPDGQAA